MRWAARRGCIRRAIRACTATTAPTTASCWQRWRACPLRGARRILQAPCACGCRAGATGVVLTKLDGTAKGGAAISVKEKLGLPVRFVGVGEGMDDLMPFDAGAFVDALFLRED